MESKMTPKDLIFKTLDLTTLSFDKATQLIKVDQQFIDILKSECERKDKIINHQKLYIEFLESKLNEKG